MIDREVVIMAARLTDRQKKKIVADYLELGSYNATAKRNGVSDTTVKRIIVEIGKGLTPEDERGLLRRLLEEYF